MQIKLSGYAFVLAILLSSSCPVLGNTKEKIDSLSKQIILKIIELEKFNLHYRMEVGKEGRWAGWRYAGLQEVQSCANLAAGIAATVERSNHFKNPEQLSISKIEKCNLIAMTGSFIGAGAAVLEFGINEFHDKQANRKGFSPQATILYISSIKNSLDELISRRHSLIELEKMSPDANVHVEELLAEEKVLLDLRDLALQEFEKFHVGGRGFVAFKKSLYLFDMSKYTCNALGNLCAFMSQHRQNRRWNLTAGVLFDTGAALVIATPYVSRGIGLIVQKIQKHSISPITKGIEIKETKILKADEKALETIARKAEANNVYAQSPLKRIWTYSNEKKVFQTEFDNIVKRERTGRLTATQTMAAGTFVGGCELAGGILYTSAGRIAHGKNFRDSSVTNYNLGTAAIINIPGNSVSIVETLRLQVKAEMAYHKASEENKLPSQLYVANMDKLDRIEQELSKPNH